MVAHSCSKKEARVIAKAIWLRAAPGWYCSSVLRAIPQVLDVCSEEAFNTLKTPVLLRIERYILVGQIAFFHIFHILRNLGGLLCLLVTALRILAFQRELLQWFHALGPSLVDQVDQVSNIVLTVLCSRNKVHCPSAILAHYAR